MYLLKNVWILAKFKFTSFYQIEWFDEVKSASGEIPHIYRHTPFPEEKKKNSIIIIVTIPEHWYYDATTWIFL